MFETNVTPGQHCLPHFTRGVSKDDQTRKLGQRFRDEDTRNYRSARKMSFEEVLITHDVPAGRSEFSGFDLKDFGQEQKRWLMGKLFDQLISPKHNRL